MCNVEASAKQSEAAGDGKIKAIVRYGFKKIAGNGMEVKHVTICNRKNHFDYFNNVRSNYFELLLAPVNGR